MRGERGLLLLGERMIGCACRRLPATTRDERCREWTAELPAILSDSAVRLPWHRAVRMLRFAAGIAWGTALTRRDKTRRLVAVGGIVFGLGAFAFEVRATVLDPADWLNYLLASTQLVLTFMQIVIYRLSFGPRRSRAGGKHARWH
jgi:hypothetical protein